MNINEFLEIIINDGIESVKKCYSKPEDDHKLKGSIDGFEACRNKNPLELRGLFEKTCKERMGAFDHDNYWRIAYKNLQVEWVCNCVSAILLNQKLPVIIPPTARGVMRAAEVAGIKQ